MLRLDVMGERQKPRTAAERYLSQRLQDADYADAYWSARDRVDRIDGLVRDIEARREELGLTKADLARRAGLRPEVIRRLLSTSEPNPTLSTLLSIARALDLELVLEPQGQSASG